MIWIVPIVIIGAAILFDDKKEKTRIDMANTNKLFLDFHKAISLSSAQMSKLASSRTAIESRILNYFKNKEGVDTPRFWIQGSNKMGNMIVKKDGTYDVDLGVYLQDKPAVTPTFRFVFSFITRSKSSSAL